MYTAPDVAREIGASRRAEARCHALVSVARLANRERRIKRRIAIAETRVAGQALHN